MKTKSFKKVFKNHRIKTNGKIHLSYTKEPMRTRTVAKEFCLQICHQKDLETLSCQTVTLSMLAYH